jgi:chemosensory pili system protein ChpA (sensor histidine kinase/response regulator)
MIEAAGEAGQSAAAPGETMETSAPATPVSTLQSTPPAAASADVLAFPAPAAVRVGELDIAPALYNMYLEEAQGYVVTLQAQLGQESVPRLEVIRAAHTLAGISAGTGFAPIHHLAQALENALVRFEQLAAPPNETQRFVFARCAGALEGMLGAVSARRMPGEEAALATTLEAMTPDVTALPAAAHEVSAAPSAPAASATAAISPVRTEAPEALDSQLLSVFMEESADLLRDIGEQLRTWKNSPEDDSVTQALARSLHTFKGSARMVGAMACSDVLHGMETRLEEALAAQTVTSAFFNEMENALDQAASLLDHLRAQPASAAVPGVNTLESARALSGAMRA